MENIFFCFSLLVYHIGAVTGMKVLKVWLVVTMLHYLVIFCIVDLGCFSCGGGDGGGS